MKEKIDKTDFIKIKNLCSAKDTVKRMKWQAINREKISAKHMSDKGLVSKIYNHLLKLNNKKTTKLQNGQKI